MIFDNIFGALLPNEWSDLIVHGRIAKEGASLKVKPETLINVRLWLGTDLLTAQNLRRYTSQSNSISA
jgi:hypothetical protein